MPIAEIRDRVVGTLGCSLTEYYGMIPYESFCRMYYIEKRENEKIKVIANIIRTATTILVNTQVKKPINDPEKLWKFGWESITEDIQVPEPIDPEVMKNVEKLFKNECNK